MDQEKITCLTYKMTFQKVTIHARGNEKNKVKHDNKTISCLLYAITVKAKQPQRTVICSGKPNVFGSVSEDERK